MQWEPANLPTFHRNRREGTGTELRTLGGTSSLVGNDGSIQTRREYCVALCVCVCVCSVVFAT